MMIRNDEMNRICMELKKRFLERKRTCTLIAGNSEFIFARARKLSLGVGRHQSDKLSSATSITLAGDDSEDSNVDVLKGKFSSMIMAAQNRPVYTSREGEDFQVGGGRRNGSVSCR